MTYLPRTPLSLPRPLGNRDDVELSSTSVELSAEPFTKMTRALNSSCWRVFVSMARTPDALPVFGSKTIECTTECGRTVRLPVFAAHGNVDELELKYPPKGHPRMQRLRAWQLPRPCTTQRFRYRA